MSDVVWWLRPAACVLCLLTPFVYITLIVMYFMIKVLDWTATDWGDVFLTPVEAIKEIWVFAYTGK